jgi:hypothetical protein
MTWRGRLSVASAAFLLFAGGCTAPAASGPPAGHTATPDPLASFGTRHTSLGCLDAIGVPADQMPAQTPIEVPLPRTDSPPPRADQAGIRLPGALQWYLRKEPLTLPAGAADVIMSVAGAKQALAWVPSSVWTSGGPPDLGPWAASSVTLHSCPDRAAQFLGGVLAADLTTCVQLSVRQAGQPERDARQLLDGSACP